MAISAMKEGHISTTECHFRRSNAIALSPLSNNQQELLEGQYARTL
jgi:hypothetical protein